jgi:hypothetical protein
MNSKLGESDRGRNPHLIRRTWKKVPFVYTPPMLFSLAACSLVPSSQWLGGSADYMKCMAHPKVQKSALSLWRPARRKL